MLVYNCKPSDAVLVKTVDHIIKFTVDSIINKPPVKQVQLRVKTDDIENSYLMKPNDSFSFQVGQAYLEVKLGHTSPSKTTLYIGALEDAMFKFIKGGTVIGV